MCRRLIPARAGNTEAYDLPRSVQAAHPRSRGEHIIQPVWTAIKTGSSPLARGTPRAGHRRHLRSRLIPARAGNTPPRS